MKPFRRAVIHVGTERTGSTSVQKAIFTDRSALREAGVLVPLSLLRSYERDAGIANHVMFVLALADPTRFPRDLVPIGIEAWGERPADIQHRILDAMRAELGRRNLGAHTVLISAEHIHSRLDTPDQVARIREVLEPWADEFLIVAVLRPQIEMAVSLANLVVRRSDRELRLIPLFDDANGYDRVLGVRPSYFELDEMLERFEAVFGREAVRVVRYESGGAFDSRVGVFAAVGARGPSLQTHDRANASLSGGALQVMRCLHRHIDLVSNPDWRHGFIDDMDQLLVRAYRGPGLRPARDAARAFMEQFAAANERIRQRYFPERSTLFDVAFDRYPDHADELGDVPDWARAMVHLLVETWLR